MSLDNATVEKIARLASIRLTAEETGPLTNGLNRILALVEQLNEVDTKGVEPMTGTVAMPLPLREDAITDGGIPDKILANAPETREGFFVVPKVVE